MDSASNRYCRRENLAPTRSPRRNSKASSPAIAVVAVFVSFFCLWFADPRIYALIMHVLGVDSWKFPFLDLSGVLASIECHRNGVDVFFENPCDPLHRLHTYSPLWLYLPISHPLTLLVPLGLVSFAAFGAAIFAILRPETRREAVIFTLAAASPTSVFALERANVDVILFAFLAFAAQMLSKRFAGRISAYLIMLTMASLKFYPAAALVSVVRERFAVASVVALISISAGAMLFAAFPVEMALIPRIAAHGAFVGGFFGATNLPSGLAVAFTSGTDALLGGASEAPRNVSMWLLVPMLGLWSILLTFSANRLRVLDTQMSSGDWNLLIVGAAVIVGCFFLGQNIDYRMIFLLLPLPALVRGAQAERTLAIASYAVLFMLWSDLIRQYVFALMPKNVSFAYWVVREAAWWTITAILGAVIAAHVANQFADRIYRVLHMRGRIISSNGKDAKAVESPQKARLSLL